MNEQTKEQSRLSYLKSTLTAHLDVTEKLTSEIRARLTAMFKWEEPLDGEKLKEPSCDALTEIIDESQRLVKYNHQLEVILRHLSKII